METIGKVKILDRDATGTALEVDATELKIFLKG